MGLKTLIKSMYTTDEVVSRWKEVHEDYDMKFLQEKIAEGKIKAYLKLTECFLFPVEEIDNSYQYLEFYDISYSGEIKNEPVHESNNVVKNLRNSKKLKIHFSAFISKEQSYFDRVNETSYISESQKPHVGKIKSSLVTEVDLDPVFMSPKFLMVDSCVEHSELNGFDTNQFLNQSRPIMEVRCSLPVTPYFWKEPFGISFIHPSSIENLHEIKLSTIDSSLNDKLALVSVVKWQDRFFYVVNKNSIKYDEENLNCYSLSSDALKSFDDGKGVVILKEDLEKIEQLFFREASSSFQINESTNIFEDFFIFNEVLEDFKNSKVYAKYLGFLKHRNRGITSEDVFEIKDIDSWIIDKLENSSIDLGYKFTGRCAELIRKLILKKYDIKKDKRSNN